ncbi:hypothetical protein NECAME_06081 [Necator americanus]|uniref:Uncharacterized protein n=1 Tax=Necator americanus TaxID=51031 RepID=W2TW71_NECAM|nr:hypothetical protein NECAME_06081 [Necator americanus]ETN86108.1 hypothetical protein NECAME_06081 [Necator americanus]
MSFDGEIFTGKVHRRLGNNHLALLNYSWATEMDPRGEQMLGHAGERSYDDDDPSPSATLRFAVTGDQSAIELLIQLKRSVVHLNDEKLTEKKKEMNDSSVISGYEETPEKKYEETGYE